MLIYLNLCDVGEKRQKLAQYPNWDTIRTEELNIIFILRLS